MTKQNKYEFTGKTKVKYGVTLHQIRALKAFGTVAVGAIGGWVANADVLPQTGDAWAYPRAEIYKDATIHGGVIRGGEIHGGVIRGGEIRGGVIRGGVIRGGEIHGGVIRGGVIRGGVIRGGVIRGGEIWGGEIWGGVIRGGEIWGGEIWGGEIWGGKIWGGKIWGGVIRRGEIRGGEIWGGETSKEPIVVLGLTWPVVINDRHITIGCEVHLINDWSKFKNDRIAKMDRHALKFWKAHKKQILGLAKATGRPFAKEESK